MLRYTLRRLLIAIPTLLLVTGIVFVVMRLLPGDPAVMLAGDVHNLELIAQIRAQYGLEQPIPLQYLRWLGQILSLDFGNSMTSGQPVLALMLGRFAVTVQVVLAAAVFAAIIAVSAGTYAAWRQNSRSDFAVVALATLCMSIRSFWIGILLILLFGLHLQWLPFIGYVSPFEDLRAGLLYLVMPIAALVLSETGALLRMVRSTTIDVLGLEYVTHARAKGVSETNVLLRHALRNTFAPTLTVLGLMLGSLLGGAAVIETMFGLPGLGQLLVSSIFARDYPTVQGIMILTAFIYVLLNLLVDLLYPLLDPRVRL